VDQRLATLVDGSVSIHSSVRRGILEFLNLKNVHRASRISEAWYEAACDPKAFETAVEKHFASNRVNNGRSHGAPATPMLPLWYPQIHTPFRFTHPGVFLHVLQSAVQYHDTLKSLLAEDDAFFKVCGSHFGSLSNRFAFQFPVLLFMLHASSTGGGSSGGFLHLKPDLTSRCEYIEKRRFLLLIANVVRWHEAYPVVGDVPWLLEVYRWASLYAPPPFDQILIMPALTLIQQHATGAVQLTERTVAELVSVTEALLARFLPVDAFLPSMLVFRSANAASSIPAGGGSNASPSLGSPPFEVEREIFRVMVLLLEQFRASMPRIKEMITQVMRPYGSLGVEELIQYRARYDVARVMKHVVIEERRLMEEVERQRRRRED
jgi:hypothetical protein